MHPKNSHYFHVPSLASIWPAIKRPNVRRLGGPSNVQKNICIRWPNREESIPGLDSKAGFEGYWSNLEL